MSNGAATLEAARTAGEAGRVSARGMRVGFSLGRMLAVTRKELQSYFAFPLVYIVTGLFAFMAGLYAWTDLDFFETIAFAFTPRARATALRPNIFWAAFLAPRLLCPTARTRSE